MSNQMPVVGGIHHVTAVASSAQTNLDFYVGVLGMRLVKMTVNFDDPGAYHLYYGDGAGTTGTALTFFHYPDGRRATVGCGAVSEIGFEVPIGAAGYWRERLTRAGFPPLDESVVGNQRRLLFADPDGILLQMVETESLRPYVPVPESDVPGDFEIRGIASATAPVRADRADETATAAVLRDLLGFTAAEYENGLTRYRSTAGPNADFGTFDLVATEDPSQARGGHGSVHHIAFRTSDDDSHALILDRVRRAGLAASGILDRTYFRSIYFREPGGILVEIATNQPGFDVDEPVEELGTGLMLPMWLEPQRKLIERALPPLVAPLKVGDRRAPAREAR
ncbi:MAG: ring-cleaving dioxygenase [Fimbriimonadaceae bacterium]